jgi:hypothetical protein
MKLRRNIRKGVGVGPDLKAERSALPERPSDRAPSPRLSPWAAFAIAGAMLLVAGAALLLGRSSSPETSLSQAGEQAASRIRLFESLEADLIAAYQQRDSALAAATLTPNSPLREATISEIRSLRKDKVFDKTTFETLDLELLQTTSDEMRIRQEVIVSPRFTDRDGQNVGEETDPQHQVVSWTLLNRNGQWFVHDVVINKSSDA